MSIKVYNDKELEKLSKKNLISLVKEYQTLPQVTSVPTEDKKESRHVRLYAKSYNNPFLSKVQDFLYNFFQNLCPYLNKFAIYLYLSAYIQPKMPQKSF